MVTVDRAEIQVEADLDESSFRRAAAQGNAILEAGVGEVEIEPDFDGFLRTLTRVGDDGGRDLGDGLQRSFSRTLIDGATNIATNFSRALQGGIISSPYIAIGLVAAVAAAAPIAGTLAAGAFVTAFGAGLVGLGIVFAAQNEQVRAAFTRLGSDLAAQLREISAPFETTLLATVGVIRRTFAALAPDLADSFAALAPAVTRFVTQIGEAFTRLAPAIAPLTDAFIEILDELGPRLPPLFDDIAAALTNVADSIDPAVFAGLIGGILELIPAILNMVAALTRAQEVLQPWFDAIADGYARVVPLLRQLFAEFGGAETASVFFRALGAVVTATSIVVAAALRSIIAVVQLNQRVIGAAATFIIAAWTRVQAGTSVAFAAIRRVVTTVVTAVRAAVTVGFNAVRTVVTTSVNAVRTTVTSGFNTARAVVTSAVNTIRSVVTSAFNTIRSTVTRVTSAVRTSVTGAFNAAASATSSAWSRITGTVTRAVGTVISTVSRLRGAITSATSGIWDGLTSGLSAAVGTIQSLVSSAIGAVQRLASAIRSIPTPKINLPNIPGFATGVRNFGGGLAVVGERGPELLALPRGSSVFTNAESRQIAAAPAAGQTNHITLINNGPQAGAELLRDLTWSLKYAVGAGVRTVG